LCGPEIYHRLQSYLRAGERSRYKALEICLDAGARCKNRDKQMPFIVRVMCCGRYHDSCQGAGFIIEQKPTQGMKNALKVFVTISKLEKGERFAAPVF